MKLSAASLSLLPSSVQVPRYDRSLLGQSHVHIGVGGFHRAHQAIYSEDLFNQNRDLEWGICGIGLMHHDSQMRDVMRRQNCLYTLVERSQRGDFARIVGSITDFLLAADDREAVLEKLAAPTTKIVSMTITEGGYYLQSSSGDFDASHPDIVRDLANPHQPSGSFGFLLEALDRRRRRGLAPFTLLSCDNIQGNGDIAKKVLLGMAELRDPQLCNWISRECFCPNSMVDRITPATTGEHRALVREQFGIEDEWPVTTEPFQQWVIEDHFVSGRPAWELVGAQMTTDVLPYEKLKLRLLNGSHQALCYIGMLLGLEFVHEAMADPQIRHLVQLLMQREVTPLLPPVPGVSVESYQATLIERFSNPAIADQLSRVGIYGSSGMPKFVLPSIEEQLRRGGPVRLLSFAVACWLRFLSGRDERGQEMPMKDPMAPRLKPIAQAAGADPLPLLAMREIFSEELAGSPIFVAPVREFLESFYSRGARATLAAALDG